MRKLLARAGDALELGDELASLRVERGFHAHVQINGCTATTRGTHAEHGGRQAAIFAYATRVGFDENARQARWQREAREFCGHLTRGAKKIEDARGMFDGLRRRRVEPVERGGRSNAHGSQGEQELREILARNLRLIRGGAAQVVLFGVEAEDGARGGASGAPRTLAGGGLADAADVQGRQSAPGRVRSNAGKAAINDGGDAFHGDGAFSDVGGEDEFLLRGRSESAILLGGCEAAMQGQHKQVGAARDGGTGSLGAANLRRAGKKGQDVALVASAQE